MLEGSLLKLGKRSSSPFGICAGAPACLLPSHSTRRLSSRFLAQTWQGDRGWLVNQHAWPRDVGETLASFSGCWSHSRALAEVQSSAGVFSTNYIVTSA